MATAVTQHSQQLVVFALGEEVYALPVAQVQEIVRYSEPRPVASDTPWIRGVISLRGKIVPVCDLGSRLGVSSEPSGEAKIVIVETDAGTAGVIVDEVEEVLTVEGEQLEPAPGASNDFIDAIAKVEDRLIILLNPESLFAGIELSGRPLAE
ncbi:MAG TPA: chemotaxis protein CheW [Clostridia bacterium]|nr:chemotaxis protein CheW [Clostridia bacterium]